MARSTEISDGAKARAFFEQNFTPLKISRLGEGDGFVTGYYEPVIEGSREANEVYNVPVYRRPSNLFVKGFSQASPDLPNKGPVYRKIGRRKLVPYYDRAQIEDGAIEQPRAGNRAGSRARPICCSRKSRARRGCSSRTARPSASITIPTTAIPIRRSDAS